MRTFEVTAEIEEHGDILKSKGRVNCKKVNHYPTYTTLVGGEIEKKCA